MEKLDKNNKTSKTKIKNDTFTLSVHEPVTHEPKGVDKQNKKCIVNAFTPNNIIKNSTISPLKQVKTKLPYNKSLK